MNREPEAMREIMQIKEAAWKEVEHLPLEQAIRERLRISEDASRHLGFTERIYLRHRSLDKKPV